MGKEESVLTSRLIRMERPTIYASVTPTTSPVATSPVATSPVATPPVATSPVATPPVATPPVTPCRLLTTGQQMIASLQRENLQLRQLVDDQAKLIESLSKDGEEMHKTIIKDNKDLSEIYELFG